MQDISNIRNIAIIGHGSCGKTSLAEAMLFTAGKIKRLGKVDEGSSALDFEEEEVQRNISINTSFHNYSWKKHDVFLMDTPGDDNFINETFVATQVTDAAVFIVGAVLGVKGQTIKFADFIAEHGLARLAMRLCLYPLIVFSHLAFFTGGILPALLSLGVVGLFFFLSTRCLRLVVGKQ